MVDAPSKKILVVDDEIKILTSLDNILKCAHYDVVCTTEGKEAIRLAKDINPDLIILDLKLPDMRGEDVFDALSEDPSTNRIPIIFLTGTISKQFAENSRKKTGNYCLLAKPTTTEEVLETVRKVLSKQ